MLTLSQTLATLKAQVLRYPIEIHDIYLGSQVAEDDDTLHFVTYYSQVNFFSYIGQVAQSYSPVSINRSAVKKGSQGEIDRVMYKICNVNKAMSEYAAQYDFRNKRIVTRLVFRQHLDDPTNAKVVVDALIQTIVFGEDKMEAQCVPIISSLAFETGWPYQINCAAKFGDTFCAVNKELAANKVTGTAESGTVGSLTDTINLTHAADYWNHGHIEITSGNASGSKRKIENFEGGVLYFDYALRSAPAAGDTYIVYRGCDKTLQMCQNVYSNDANYHGFHTIPLNKNDD